MIAPDADLNPPRRIVEDMHSFLEQVATEKTDLSALGLKTIALGSVLDGLRKLYTFDVNQP